MSRQRPTERGKRSDPRAPTAGVESLAAGTGRSAAVLVAGLALLALTRLVSSVPSSTWGWGFGSMRFSPPLAGWVLWVLAALALAPALSRRLGRALDGPRVRTAWIWPAVVIGLVWALPDRLHFIGDSLMRRGSVLMEVRLNLLYPQALGLDLLLHVNLQRFLIERFGLEVVNAARATDALEAGILTLCAIGFARAMGWRGAASFAAVSVIALGGTLMLFTGYNKAASEMCVVVVAMGFLGVRLVRTGHGLLPLAIVTTFGLALHRMGALLVPAFVVAYLLWLRSHGGGGRWRRPLALLALVIPIVAIVVLGPRIYALIVDFDLSHHLPSGSGGKSFLGGVFDGRRLLDLVNVFGALCPVTLAALPLLFMPESRPLRLETVYLASLVLPLMALTLVGHPQQGLFRDIDVYAPAAVALSLLAAWLVGETLNRGKGATWLAAPVAMAALATSASWLALHHDLERGRVWVGSFVREPPSRSGTERALTWEFLGNRFMETDQWEAAAAAYGHAVESAPSPKMLTLWAMAETMTGNLASARDHFRRAVALDPSSALAWRGVASTAFRLHDYAEARAALERLKAMKVDAPEIQDISRGLDEVEGRATTGSPAPPRD